MAATLTARSNPTPRSGGSSSRSTPSRGQLALVENEGRQVTLPELKNNETSLDRTKPLPTSLQSDFIPDEVLFALSNPAPPNEKLGPPTRYRNLSTTVSQSRKPPANVWNFPKRREQFKHLTENTACVCGAGKDISFLYDVPKKETTVEKTDISDKTRARAEELERSLPQHQLQLPDTLIPDEYHIVKNKGVMGLEYHEDQFANQPVDHEKHLVMFPSMNPTSRYEVMQLKKAMEEMMVKIGANEDLDDVQGPTQMHQLLELIKKEQNVYNIVFHELIRQVSVECLDRGQLLSELRSKYSGLLSKIPKQVKGLHEEVMAQRALDRRLTEELMRFKSTIGALTNELTDVKEHDKEVTQQANKAQDDLKYALVEAQKNSGLLGEYHDLYELQRQRLEIQVSALSEEREIWSKAAYSLALKVTEEHSLNTAKRLHISEKTWAKLAKHFTIRLSDADTTMLTRLQDYAEKFRELVDEFSRNLKTTEAEMKNQLYKVKAGLHKWISDFERNVFDKDGLIVMAPDEEKTMAIYKDIKIWEELLNQESERYSGDDMLTGQEALQLIRRQVDGWTDAALKVFNRHRGDRQKERPDWEAMNKLNEEVEDLLNQFQVRFTGENGAAKGIINLSNNFETWDNKLNGIIIGGSPLPELEWTRLYQLMDDWVVSVDETLTSIGLTQKQEDRDEEKPHTEIEVHETLKKTHKWLTSTCNSFDSEDAKLVEQVSSLHTEMVKWMVRMLLRLAPDKKENSAEAAEAALLGSASIGQLQSNAKSLFEQLDAFTEYVASCCMGIVTEEMQAKLDRNEDNADQEFKDLRKLKLECDEWTHTAKIMLSELSGDALPESLQPSLTDIPEVKAEEEQGQEGVTQGQQEGQGQQEEKESEGQTEGTDKGDVVYSDKEKLEKPSEGTEAEKTTEPDVKSVTPNTKEKTDETIEANQEQDATSNVRSKEQSLVSDTIAEEIEEEEDDTLEVIGFDESTHQTKLEQNPSESPKDNSRPLARKFSDSKGRPSTPDTKKAYEALAAVQELQSQLISTEERAQIAEERASDAESDLVIAQEAIRALERLLHQQDPEIHTEPTAETSKNTKPEAKPTASKTPEPTQTKSHEKEKSVKRESHSRSSSRASTKSKKK